MNMHGAKNEFHLRVHSNFHEANITIFNVGTSHGIVGGEGYMPTNGCSLSVSVDCYNNRGILGVLSNIPLGKANVLERPMFMNGSLGDIKHSKTGSNGGNSCVFFSLDKRNRCFWAAVAIYCTRNI
jgi:hypothetical protein